MTQPTIYDPELDPLFPPTDHQRLATVMCPLWACSGLLWVGMVIASAILGDWVGRIIFIPLCLLGAFYSGYAAFDFWCEKLPKNGRMYGGTPLKDQMP